MNTRLTATQETFLAAHSGLSANELAQAHEAAQWNAERLNASMKLLAENPLDLMHVPHADQVIALLPDGMHPLELASFFTTPRHDLVMDGAEVSVRDWLLHGGDPQPVLWYAESMNVLG